MPHFRNDIANIHSVTMPQSISKKKVYYFGKLKKIIQRPHWIFFLKHNVNAYIVTIKFSSLVCPLLRNSNAPAKISNGAVRFLPAARGPLPAISPQTLSLARGPSNSA